MTEPRLKGLAIINIRHWFDERLGTGWFTQTAREHEPAWPERLLPGEWYSIRTCFYVNKRGFEQLRGYEPSFAQMIEEVAAEGAHKDLKGLLRVFLWATTPKMFLRAIPKIWDTYANFGTAVVLSNEVGHIQIRASNIPADVIDWVTPTWAGFLIPALKLAGGNEPKVKISEVKQTPGADTWEFLYELTYS